MLPFKHHRHSASRKAFQQCRGALQVRCLHKALRTPSAGPITAPADVVYECLTLLRKPDLDSLAPFFPASSFDPGVSRVGPVVGGESVHEAGPLACCHGFMDTAARRVLPGHLLRRCRLLSSVQLGEVCQMRVELTACTGEEAVFVWRLRRAEAEAARARPLTAPEVQSTASGRDALPPASSSHSRPGPSPGPGARADHDPEWRLRPGGEAASGRSGASTSLDPSTSSSSSSRSGISISGGSVDGGSGRPGSFGDGVGEGDGGRSAGGDGRLPSGRSAATAAGPAAAAVTPAAAGSRSASQPPQAAEGAVTAWVVESIRRDDAGDEEELPVPGPAGRGPHPRCSPELVVKAQLAALRRGDVAGAASFNLWSRSTSGGWELHLSAFRAMLRQPSYHVLLTSDDAKLGPSALPTGRRMLQEVQLRTTVAAAAAGGRAGLEGGPDDSPGSALVFEMCMQANGCWLVDGIHPVR